MKKGVLYASIIAVVLAMVGCSKYKVASFVMPSWDTQFTAPLFNRTYTLGEILSKDSVMASNGDTTLLQAKPPDYVFTLFRTQNLNADSVGDNLKITSTPTTTADQSPTDFQIDPPNPVNYALVDPSLPVGFTGPVPAIPQRNDTLDPDLPFNNFKSATLTQGTVTVLVHNGYPTPVTFSPTGLTVTDISNNTIFNIPVTPNPLAAGQTVQLTHSLAGYTFPNNPRVSFTYSAASAASGTMQSDTILAFTISLSGMRASQAVAVVPKQEPYTINRSIIFTDGNKVKTADIKSGTLTLTVSNGFEVPDTIDLVLKSLVRQNNRSDTLRTSFVLQPLQSNFTLPIDLSGYELSMADQYGNPTDSLLYRATAASPGSETLPDSFVTISNTQSIHSEFMLSDLQLSSFTGEVHLKNAISIPTDTQNVNLGDFRTKFSGAIEFGPSTQLELDVTGIGFPCLAHITLTPGSSTSSSPPVDSAVVDAVIQPGMNRIILGQSFVNALNAFARARNTIPDQFIISGYVLVNPSPYTTTGTVSDTDKVAGTGTISMPFDLGIINATYVDTTNSAVINDSSTSAKMDNVDSGRVVFEIWNGLPLDITMMGQLIDTTTHAVIMNFPGDSIRIAAADINTDGSVRDSVFSKNSISLTSEQAKDLGRSYMRFFFRLATPSGAATVPFKKDNDISLRVYGNFAFKVDKNVVGK